MKRSLNVLLNMVVLSEPYGNFWPFYSNKTKSPILLPLLIFNCKMIFPLLKHVKFCKVFVKTTFFSDSNFGHTNFAMRLSQLTGVFMCGSVHSAISIALGRYIALVYPLKYSILFSKRNTIIYAAIAWITGIMQHAPTLFRMSFIFLAFFEASSFPYSFG